MLFIGDVGLLTTFTQNEQKQDFRINMLGSVAIQGAVRNYMAIL
jgi:hypothetical protein